MQTLFYVDATGYIGGTYNNQHYSCRERVVDGNKVPAILLHTSGVAVVMDDGKEGKHDPGSKV